MATKEEILSTFDSSEGTWFAYKEGIQVGYNEAINSLRNQAAIAAMQGFIQSKNTEFYSLEDVKKWQKVIIRNSIVMADALIEELKKK